MDTLEKRLKSPFADTIALMGQNDSSRFSYVKNLGKKAVSTGLMLSMLYASTASLSASTESSLESSTGYFEKADPNSGVKKKKKGPLLWIAAGAAAIAAGVILATSKKGDDPVKKEYNVTFQNKDVVTDAAVNGNLTVKLANGTTVSGSSGGQFRLVDSNSISDVVVTDAAGHYTGYAVFTDSDGNVLGYKDKNGMNKPFAVQDGKQYSVRLISDSIDVKLLANCVGNQLNGDVGDGTIFNYNTSDGNINGVVEKKAAIMKGTTDNPQDPTDYTVTTFKRALDMLNNIPHNRVKWKYVGIVTEKLSDGMTYFTKTVSPGGASNVSSSTINSSFFSARADAGLRVVLEESVNNGGSAIFWDAEGYDGHNGQASPYISIYGDPNNPTWENNAQYAIALSNGPLPRGFKLSTNSVPASQASSLMSQPFENSFTAPFSRARVEGSLSGTKSGSHYNSPGNKAGPVERPSAARDSSVRKDYERRQ